MERDRSGRFRSYADQCSDAGIEVFWHDETECDPDSCWIDDDGKPLPSGFYWWSCSPGCLPDGDPNGPYETELEAQREALAY